MCGRIVLKGSDSMDRMITQEAALRTAFFSSQMEGFEITSEVEANCRKLLDGGISLAELVQQITEKHATRKESEESCHTV